MAEVSIFTRNLEMTPRLQEYVERKVSKLDRYLPSVDEARMELKVEDTRSANHRQVAQLTVRARSTILRAEERTNDMFASIDAVLDKMYRQIARYKGKRQDRWHAVAEKLPIEEPAEEPAGEIVRVKNFEIHPMTPEEAIEQMELLDHQFYVFLNASEDAINVLYKRDDDNYGLLKPKLA